MGVFAVKQIDNYFLIPALGVGGISIDEDEGGILLNDGYQIIKKSKGEYHTTESFNNHSKEYVRSTESNVQRDLGGGQLAQESIKQYEIIKLLADHNCRVSKEVRQLQRWLLRELPDIARPYLYQEKGHVVTLMGEALRLEQCQQIDRYTVH